MTAGTIVCDCHFAPMSYEAVSLLPECNFVMCWMSDCGRYYSRPLGYFCLREATVTSPKHIDKETQKALRCISTACPVDETLALVRSPFTGSSTVDWHCFVCGKETHCDGDDPA
jgi:hypothetical protein